MIMLIKFFVVGNWKMNGLKVNMVEFYKMVVGWLFDLVDKVDVMICLFVMLIVVFV